MRLFRSKDKKNTIKNFVVCILVGREGQGYTSILNSEYSKDPFLKTMSYRITEYLNQNYPLDENQ